MGIARGARPWRAMIAFALLTAALTLQPRASAAAVEYFVATDGSDAGPGSAQDPWGTLEHAMQQLTAGDTLWVRGGTYDERIQSPPLTSGTSAAPITVAAYPGERPVIEGLLWLRDADHWVFDGINVTWDDATGQADEHMVKLTDGVGWTFRNAEIWGARSYAAMLVAGTVAGEPAGWEVSGNCIHDTYATNNTNQDHNLYVNSGLNPGAGLIERNLMFGAPNGENIKLAGSSSTSGGAASVDVRYNTLVDAAQNVLIAWDSHDIVLERNLISGAGGTYANVRAYQSTGLGNVIRDSAGHDASALVWNDSGSDPGVADGGGNVFGSDPQFDDTTSCSGFRPTNPDLEPFGHLAGTGGSPTEPEPNSPPVATDDAATTVEATSVTIDVLANDSDADGDALAVTATTGPTSGLVLDNADGTLTYTPDPGFTGSDAFTYTVSDPSGASDTGTLTIDVTAALALTAVHVSDLTGVANWVTNKHWVADVTVTVANAVGLPVAGVDVSGTWSSADASGAGACTTSLQGRCTLTSERTKGSTITFALDAINGSTYEHDPSADKVTSVTVTTATSDGGDGGGGGGGGKPDHAGGPKPK